MKKTEIVKTYTCQTCNWSIDIERYVGTTVVTNKSVFALSKAAPNYGEGCFCKTCGNLVSAQ